MCDAYGEAGFNLKKKKKKKKKMFTNQLEMDLPWQAWVKKDSSSSRNTDPPEKKTF